MSAPRPIWPKSYCFITRRCTQRQFWLRPDDKTNAAFLYCLAEAAQRYGIRIVCVGMQSNHYHAIVYDEHGRLPAFLAHFHKMVAKVMNCRWGRWENLWATEPTCVVVLVGPDDVFDKMIYSLGNPAKDHLVDRVVHWPGASSLGAQLRGKPLTVRRPDWFFDPHGSMPEELELDFMRPEAFADLTQQDWAERILSAIGDLEAAAAAERRERKIPLLGRKAIRAQKPSDSPSSWEPRRGLRPRIACRSRWHREEAIRRDKTFRERYAEALRKLRAGVREVLFPAGTYLLRVRGLACCEPFG